MAYAKPPTFAVSDYPTAANLNILGANDTAINDLIDNFQIMHGYGAKAPSGTKLFYFTHLYRWLYYRGTGSIEDALGENDDVTLSSTSHARYDLHSIDWLYPGRLIRVADTDYAFEKG